MVWRVDSEGRRCAGLVRFGAELVSVEEEEEEAARAAAVVDHSASIRHWRRFSAALAGCLRATREAIWIRSSQKVGWAPM